jgi:hypothetical protein
MKLRTDTYAKTDVAFDDITDETILKLQLMGIKFIDRKNPVCPSRSVTLFPNLSGGTAKQSPETADSPQQTVLVNVSKCR